MPSFLFLTYSANESQEHWGNWNLSGICTQVFPLMFPCPLLCAETFQPLRLGTPLPPYFPSLQLQLGWERPAGSEVKNSYKEAMLKHLISRQSIACLSEEQLIRSRAGGRQGKAAMVEAAANQQLTQVCSQITSMTKLRYLHLGGWGCETYSILRKCAHTWSQYQGSGTAGRLTPAQVLRDNQRWHCQRGRLVLHWIGNPSFQNDQTRFP